MRKGRASRANCSCGGLSVSRKMIPHHLLSSPRPLVPHSPLPPDALFSHSFLRLVLQRKDRNSCAGRLAARPLTADARGPNIRQIAVHSQSSLTRPTAAVAGSCWCSRHKVLCWCFTFLFVPRIFFLEWKGNGRGRLCRRPPLTHFTPCVRVSAFTFSP